MAGTDEQCQVTIFECGPLNAAHGYGDASNYMTRRRWDYFVRNLLGLEPPRDYVLGPAKP